MISERDECQLRCRSFSEFIVGFEYAHNCRIDFEKE